jgi:hypothetical protein
MSRSRAFFPCRALAAAGLVSLGLTRGACLGAAQSPPAPKSGPPIAVVVIDCGQSMHTMRRSGIHRAHMALNARSLRTRPRRSASFSWTEPRHASPPRLLPAALSLLPT